MDKNRKLKDYELKVLEEFDRICSKYDLKYYLAYGSALGAVRHKGFIPWDDDIDVHMMINDLEKFRKICQKELNNDFYIQNKLSDKYYYNYWTKLGLENTTWMPKQRLVNCKYGICIDIFPIFPLKNNKKDKNKIEKYMRLLNIACSKYYVVNHGEENSKIKIMIQKIIPDFIGRILYRIAIYKLGTSINDYDLIMINGVSEGKNFYFDKNDIEGNKFVKFEGVEKRVPNNFDEYLTTFYGDYMTPPEESKRYGHDKDNNSIIIDFDKSYMEYMGDDKNAKN